jgi:hypothetical protein
VCAPVGSESQGTSYETGQFSLGLDGSGFSLFDTTQHATAKQRAAGCEYD